MPADILPIVIISILSGTGLLFFLIWTVSEYFKSRDSGGSALTTSELSEMIKAASEEVIEPLKKRIETLEAIATDEKNPDLLAGVESYYEPPAKESDIKVTRSSRSGTRDS